MNKFPPHPPIAPMTIEYLDWIHSQVNAMTGAGAEVGLITHPGSRTLQGIMQQAERAGEAMHARFGGVDIFADPYVQRTVRRQFRFPRSKKKRIRKKWRKQARNWREEEVLWMVNMNDLKLRLPEPRRIFMDDMGAV